MSFKRLSTILLSLGVLFFSGMHHQDIPGGDTGRVTVMSYNIQHGKGMDGVVDLERIAGVIIDEGADIVGLQEVDVGVQRSGRQDIAAELSQLTGLEYHVFGKNLDHDGGDYGVAVLSRYPISDYENMQFEQLGNEQRSIQAMQIDVRGFPVLLMNTHLAHRGVDEPERLQYMNAARDEIIPGYTSARAVLFVGDFNDVPGSATHLAVKEYMKDVWEIAGDGGDGFTIPPDNPTRRIDYIFYDGELEPVDARVPHTLSSDHLPVVATFKLNEKE